MFPGSVRALVVSAFTAATMVGSASIARAAPVPVDAAFTVVNQRGIHQFSFFKLAGDSFFSNSTDGNGQFSAAAFSCTTGIGLCVHAGDHLYFSRDQGADPAQSHGCSAPEDPAGFDYVVTTSPTQTVTLSNTTGDSSHTALTDTESWIVGKLNQDRAAHNPPIPPLHVSSTLDLVAYAIAHDRATAAGHPYPPPFCFVNLSDWGWPTAGFLNEDSPYAAPVRTLAHWDGTDGTAESINLANHGVFNSQNTAVGVAYGGGGQWIIEYNNCSIGVDPAFAARCGMTSSTGDANAYTPPPPDSRPPVVGGLTALPPVFVAAASGASIARATGTTISYRDSQAAATTFTVLELRRGVKNKRGSCVITGKKRRGTNCTHWISVGHFVHSDLAGPNSFHFTGRVGARKLEPGKYRFQVVPRGNGVGGTSGAPAALAFRVITWRMIR